MCPECVLTALPAIAGAVTSAGALVAVIAATTRRLIKKEKPS